MSAELTYNIAGYRLSGSIGCVVASDFTVVTPLYELLTEMEADKLPPPTLQVIAVGSAMDQFLNISRIA